LAKIGNNWLICKLLSAIFTFFRSWNTPETVLERLHLKMRLFKKNRIFSFLVYFVANFSHILWSKNHVLKKVCRGSSHNLFSIWYFLNLKSVTVYYSIPSDLGQQVPQHDVNASLAIEDIYISEILIFFGSYLKSRIIVIVIAVSIIRRFFFIFFIFLKKIHFLVFKEIFER
jgi:hypothetical protein